MKYISAADLHIRFNRPQYRKDNYFRTVCRKLRQIVFLCNKYGCDLIIAGDVFDSVKVGHKVVNAVLEILKKLKGKVLVVAGQHDQVFHTKDLEGSPLFTLILSGKVMLLNREDYYFDGENNIYGCSFGEEPIKPKTKNNILVIHKSITEYEPPFFLPDAIECLKALKLWSDYYLIIAGDFHKAFMASGENILINCGPMMRSSIDQMDTEPVVWRIDTAKRDIKALKLKIEPKESVFAIEEIVKKDQSAFSKELGELVEALKDESDRPDYKETVNLLMNDGKVSDTTRDKVNYIFGSVIDGRDE